MTHEELLAEYLRKNGLSTHKNFVVESVCISLDGSINFMEKSEDGYYAECHNVPLLDMFCFVYQEVGVPNMS